MPIRAFENTHAHTPASVQFNILSLTFSCLHWSVMSTLLLEQMTARVCECSFVCVCDVRVCVHTCNQSYSGWDVGTRLGLKNKDYHRTMETTNSEDLKKQTHCHVQKVGQWLSNTGSWFTQRPGDHLWGQTKLCIMLLVITVHYRPVTSGLTGDNTKQKREEILDYKVCCHNNITLADILVFHWFTIVNIKIL